MKVLNSEGIKVLTARQIRKMHLNGMKDKPTPSPFVNTVLGLKKGHGVLVSKKGWGKKSTPYSLFVSSGRKAKKKGFKVSSKTLADGSGWLLTRV